jgi:small-conductance mechanosensitive channel
MLMPEAQTIDRVVRDFQQIDFLRILIIILVAWLSIRLVTRFLPWLADRLTSRLRLYILPSVPVLRLLILIMAVVVIVPQIIQPTFQNLITFLGAAGIALGFALKDYASSIMAGIVALYERPYRVGDWVEIDGAYGEVIYVGLRMLRLVTPDDTMVTIPHIKIWDSNIYNANDGNRDLMVVVNFYLEPKHDGAQVRQILYDVALTSPYVNLDRPILVIVAEKPWGTHYKLKTYPVDARDQFQFLSDLTIRGKAALMDSKVEAAFALPALMAENLQQAAGG